MKAIREQLDNQSTDTVIDNYSNASYTYVGRAPIGTLTSESKWQILRINKTTGFSFGWAGKTEQFNQVWDDRASLTYSGV